ncbi:Threonine synthase [Mycovorax composti]|jgi:threonine synthase|uniref:Threonine synthase n=1 Tax=Mycovorax composti TaxID=2962693 RepID=A0ABZ2ENX2_9BACT
MNYYSLNQQSPIVSFKDAAIQGQAPDKGLYFPEKLPRVNETLIKNIESIADVNIAFEVMKPYVAGSIDDENLYRIVKETISFPIPLNNINDQIASLELFHGPTLAFKDVGARFMSRCLGYFLRNEDREVTVLVATSGDTGGAVANGFYNVENVNVVILYPKGRVSPVQEKQLTTLGNNITALEVDGSFDDCQRMVKQAFADKEINEQKFLTSANSINVARWLPQQIYYFLAYKQWKEKSISPVVCVPSGNFGNICAGMLAKVTGLPLGHFIAACNVNDIVSHYLQTQELVPKQTTPTLSNAMDVGNPSNFIRIIELYNKQFPELKNNLSAYTITDAETLATIKIVAEKYQYTLEPHGAVAYLALERYLENHSTERGFILETAHPVKFPDAVKEATGKDVEVPAVLEEMMHRPKKSILMKPEFEALKSWLLEERK